MSKQTKTVLVLGVKEGVFWQPPSPERAFMVYLSAPCVRLGVRDNFFYLKARDEIGATLRAHEIIKEDGKLVG